MKFLTIIPRSKKMGEYSVNSAILKVVKDSGVNTVPDMSVNVTDLNSVNNTRYKHFMNNGYGGITFKVDVIIEKSDYFMGYRTKKMNGKNTLLPNAIRVVTALNYFIKNMTPLSVVSKAIDVPNGVYIITKNSSRKQDTPNHTVWSLEFTTYNGKTTTTSKKTTTKTTKTSSTKKATLGPACLKYLVYSKKRSYHACVKLMQQILYRKGCLKKTSIDGWYSNVTVNAVKKFQKKFQKKYGLKVTGKVDNATLDALKRV